MGESYKSLVNIKTFSDEHFEDQAIKIKQLYYKYKARRVIIDGNGLGIGLIDYMIKQQIDSATGDIYPPFGVYNDDEGYYKKYQLAFAIINQNIMKSRQARTFQDKVCDILCTTK